MIGMDISNEDEHKIEIDYIVEDIIKNHKKSHINHICSININGKESHLYDEDCVSRMLIKMYFLQNSKKENIKYIYDYLNALNVD